VFLTDWRLVTTPGAGDYASIRGLVATSSSIGAAENAALNSYPLHRPDLPRRS
jgi:hypothetical protein